MQALSKILVTGSNGQLGTEMHQLSKAFPGYQFLFFNRAEWPVDDAEKSENILALHQPSFLVNCAAYTAVDKAETDREAAFSINATAPGTLARLCQAYGTRFIHISTDYVFNGIINRPLKEDDSVQPVNYYGETKLVGEQAVLQHNPDALIIRTSWVYNASGKNFVKTMMRLMKEKESISVVNDQHGSPTYAADLAEAIMHIITSGRWVPGIYHFSNEGFITWYQFAEEIRNQCGFNCKVDPIVTAEFPTPAKRPMFSMMDKSKIVATFGLTLKDWKESLRDCIALTGNS
jgi:dTDP-4-dehydrorhamnose reductase